MGAHPAGARGRIGGRRLGRAVRPHAVDAAAGRAGRVPARGPPGRRGGDGACRRRGGHAMCLSTIATATPASVAAAAPDTERWLQLYCFSDSAVTEAIIAEAVESGFSAIALTVDAPRAGRRERDLRNGRQDGALRAGRAGGRRIGRAADAEGGVRPGRSLARLGQPGRARRGLRAADSVEGPDGARPTPSLRSRPGAAGRDRLQPRRPPARRGAGDDRRPRRRSPRRSAGRVPVLMDGGVRRGGDVLTALALGASAVLVGRPALWGLAVGRRGRAPHASSSCCGPRSSSRLRSSAARPRPTSPASTCGAGARRYRATMSSQSLGGLSLESTNAVSKPGPQLGLSFVAALALLRFSSCRPAGHRGPAEQDVLAGPSVDVVVSFAALDRVVPGAAEQAAGNELIAVVAPVDLVVAWPAVD